MATPEAATGVRPERSEEANALYGVVMALTAASGGMIAAFAAIGGDTPLILLPTIALVVCLSRRAPSEAAWSGLLVWAMVLLMAPGIAMLAPALMGMACLAFAVGPDRLLDWFRDEWIGRVGDEPVEVGWIEDDGAR